MLGVMSKVVQFSKFITVLLFATLIAGGVLFLLDILIYVNNGVSVIANLNKNFVFLMLIGGILISSLIVSFAILLNITSMQDIEKERINRGLFKTRIKIYKDIFATIKSVNILLNQVLQENKWHENDLKEIYNNYLNETHIAQFYFNRNFINYKKDIDNSILNIIKLFESSRDSDFLILNEKELKELKDKKESLEKKSSILDSKFKSYKISF